MAIIDGTKIILILSMEQTIRKIKRNWHQGLSSEVGT